VQVETSAESAWFQRLNLENDKLLPSFAFNWPISIYRLREMPIQCCGQSVRSPRAKAGARLNAHTELRAERQRSAREAIYRKRPISTCAPIFGAGLPGSSSYDSGSFDSGGGGGGGGRVWRMLLATS